jgi:hypothetical protein
MQISTLIIDNFYSHPKEIREFALSQNFDRKGNYPGCRSKPYLPSYVKNQIQRSVQNIGTISNWYENELSTGCFQITTARDRTWVHADHEGWAGVCYLTPNAPHSSGTGLFRNKITGKRSRKELINKDEWMTNPDYDGYDYTKWDLVDILSNQFNRLVIYRADLFHASLDYFGNDLYTGRLFQVFFFDINQNN